MILSSAALTRKPLLVSPWAAAYRSILDNIRRGMLMLTRPQPALVIRIIHVIGQKARGGNRAIIIEHGFYPQSNSFPAIFNRLIKLDIFDPTKFQFVIYSTKCYL